MSLIDTIKVTVAQGATASSVGDADGGILLRVCLPTVTSTAFTIQPGHDLGGTMTYLTEYIDGADKSFTCASSKSVNVYAAGIVCNKFKIVMGSAEAAARDIYVQVLHI
jgi:hypothetical protein